LLFVAAVIVLFYVELVARVLLYLYRLYSHDSNGASQPKEKISKTKLKKMSKEENAREAI